MSCTDVREQLSERALAILDPGDLADIDRHLEWCAGCRKESVELAYSAAALGLTALPGSVPEQLEEQVVDAVRRSAGTARPAKRRGRRAAAAAVIAAFVAVAGLGWGAVMAGRADRFRVRAEHALSQRDEALRRFRLALASLPLGPPESLDAARMGRMSPVPGRGAGGAGGTALVLVSRGSSSYAFVIVEGLDPKQAGPLPYRVSLMDGNGARVSVGAIARLDTNGGEQVLHQFESDLSGFTRVMVRNADGRDVLQGTISADARQSAR